MGVIPKQQRPVIPSVADIFCGVGGLSHGFKLEGFRIACGVDLDEMCRFAFEENNDAEFLSEDITRLSAKQIKTAFSANALRVMVGCAPCQPFSIYNQKNKDPQWKLLGEFGRLIQEIRPEIISMENVPSLVRFKRGRTFNNFVKTLKASGYHVWWSSVYCPDYGIPQGRTRLVLLASLLGPLELERPTHLPEQYVTVRDAIGRLPKLRAGSIDKKDPLHRASRLSKTNMKRMKAAKAGSTWRGWSKYLVAKCHRRKTGKTYPSVYGRMTWDDPSPTITTQYYGFGNGRFGHPTQQRAISLREGAILQTFPKKYKFVQPGKPIHFKRIGRLIGNAVPVLLARAIARSVKAHLEVYS